MSCELKQAVLSLGQELTPAEIRIGRGTPSWVAETGIPTFYHPVQTSDPASGLRVRPHRFDDRLIRHGSQTGGVDTRLLYAFDDRLIRHGSQTTRAFRPSAWAFDDRLIRRGSQTYSRCSDCSCGFGNWLIRHGNQTPLKLCPHFFEFGDRLIRRGSQTCALLAISKRALCGQVK